MNSYKEMLRKFLYIIFASAVCVQIYGIIVTSGLSQKLLQSLFLSWSLLFALLVYQYEDVSKKYWETKIVELHLETELLILKNRLYSQSLSLETRKQMEFADKEFLRQVRLKKTICKRDNCLICNL